jgi:hypothetical protein
MTSEPNLPTDASTGPSEPFDDGVEIRRLIGGYTAAIDAQVDQQVTDELVDAQLRRVLDVVNPTNHATSRIHIPTSRA